MIAFTSQVSFSALQWVMVIGSGLYTIFASVGIFLSRHRDKIAVHADLWFDEEIRLLRRHWWTVRRLVQSVTTQPWRTKWLNRMYERGQIALSLDNQPVRVDRKMIPIIHGLYALGLPTRWSCQGHGIMELLLAESINDSHNQRANIILQPGFRFPDDLLSAAERAGCFSTAITSEGGQSLETHLGLPGPFCDQANRALRRLLFDFLNERLDTKGCRYRRMVSRWAVNYVSQYRFNLGNFSTDSLAHHNGVKPTPIPPRVSDEAL